MPTQVAPEEQILRCFAPTWISAFTGMTELGVSVGRVLRDAAAQLQRAGVPSAALDARLLLQHVLVQSHAYIATHPDEALTEVQQQAYDALVQRRIAREPVACIIGEKGFWDLIFKTTSDTLDPRPDTEVLVEAIEEHAPTVSSILDLGTGTGCLLLTLLHVYPDARGVGVDISPEALKVAQENAVALGLAERVEFRHGNWAEGLEEAFDIIVSNPPYIPTEVIATLEPEVQQYDPKLALDGGADGLEAYKALLPTLRGKLKPNGLVCLEFGEGQEPDVVKLVKESGLSIQGLKKDFSGIVRCVVCSL